MLYIRITVVESDVFNSDFVPTLKTSQKQVLKVKPNRGTKNVEFEKKWKNTKNKPFPNVKAETCSKLIFKNEKSEISLLEIIITVF